MAPPGGSRGPLLLLLVLAATTGLAGWQSAGPTLLRAKAGALALGEDSHYAHTTLPRVGRQGAGGQVPAPGHTPVFRAAVVQPTPSAQGRDVGGGASHPAAPVPPPEWTHTPSARGLRWWPEPSWWVLLLGGCVVTGLVGFFLMPAETGDGGPLALTATTGRKDEVCVLQRSRALTSVSSPILHFWPYLLRALCRTPLVLPIPCPLS